MQSNTYRELDRASQRALVVLAVLQAALLLALHKSIEHDLWPATDLRWLLAVYATAVGWPFFCYMGVVELRDRANVIAGALAALVIFWLGWHAGWIAGQDSGGWRPRTVLVDQVAAGSLAIFIAAFVFRAWRESGGRGLPYPRLIDLSWLNALTLAFLLLFIGAFWLILILWAGLFSILDIDFFGELFSEAEFIYPATGLVGGFGLVMIRNRARLIATVRGLCEALIRALLPLTAFVVVIFLAALPFTGLEPLWDTRFGTVLVTTLAFVLLFFFNAELGGEQEEHRYAAPLRWLLMGALVLLPAILAIAARGLALRVGQHGWTVERLWAFFVIAMLGAYALGYAFMILRHRRIAHAAFGRWNTVLAVALAAALVLVISPVLDFRGRAAANQVERLERGAVDPAQFDVWHLLTLGRYGVRALEALQSGTLAAQNPELSRRIDDALAGRGPWNPTLATMEVTSDRIVAFPGSDPPADLTTMIAAHNSTRMTCAQPRIECRLAAIDVDGERWWAFYATVGRERQGPIPFVANSQLLRRGSDGGWLIAGSLAGPQCPSAWQSDVPPEVPVLLTEPAPFLRIGNCAYPLMLLLEPQALAEAATR